MYKILLVLAIVLCILIVKICIDVERNKKMLLVSSSKIPLETVMMFSIADITRRLKRYYKKEEKIILIEYADDKWFELDTKESQKKLIEAFDKIQSFMIAKRYYPDEDYVVKDSINKIMYDVWLDYAYKSNYKALFWREINSRYEVFEISKSTYNRIYKRFYKYKFLENK